MSILYNSFGKLLRQCCLESGSVAASSDIFYTTSGPMTITLSQFLDLSSNVLDLSSDEAQLIVHSKDVKKLYLLFIERK